MKSYETELNLKATELRLGLPGSDEPQEKRSCSGSAVRSSNKRSSPESSVEESRCKSNVNSDTNTSDSTTTSDHEQDSVQPAK